MAEISTGTHRNNDLKNKKIIFILISVTIRRSRDGNGGNSGGWQSQRADEDCGCQETGDGKDEDDDEV